MYFYFVKAENHLSNLSGTIIPILKLQHKAVE